MLKCVPHVSGTRKLAEKWLDSDTSKTDILGEDSKDKTMLGDQDIRDPLC